MSICTKLYNPDYFWAYIRWFLGAYPTKISRNILEKSADYFCVKKIIRDNPVYIFLDNPDYLVIFLDILQYFPGFFFNRENPAAYRNNQKIIRDFLLIFPRFSRIIQIKIWKIQENLEKKRFFLDKNRIFQDFLVVDN